MGWCGFFLRFTGYTLVAFIAILGYFHMECMNEKDDKPKFNEKFDPKETIVKGLEMPFTVKGQKKYSIDIGLEYMLKQSCPCALMKLINHFSKPFDNNDGTDLMSTFENKTITIHDARKDNPGSFHESGFTLIELDEVPITKDWRTAHHSSPDADVRHFTKQMEPHIKKLYPKVKRFLWTHNVVRGGTQAGDQPVAGNPHLDYHQNKDLRLKFHKDKPAIDSYFTLTNVTEPDILMGKHDTESDKLGVLLGVWKPIYPDTVCDHPLAVMDARTFNHNDDLPFEIAINFGFFTFNNLNGAIAYSPKQKWYYYPFQSTKEVLIFHQYSEGKSFANPHTAFFNKNCPKDTPSRQSVEFRVALFF